MKERELALADCVGGKGLVVAGCYGNLQPGGYENAGSRVRGFEGVQGNKNQFKAPNLGHTTGNAVRSLYSLLHRA
jgi:hypothetical protein